MPPHRKFDVFCYITGVYLYGGNMKVEKGIPAPLMREVIDYPYENMEVGDSFFVEGGTLNRMCYQNRRWGKKLGGRFTVKKVEGGVRVWRVE
jgi:hypothetical protein